MRCRKLLAAGGTAPVLVVGATDCCTTAHRRKASSIASSVQYRSCANIFRTDSINSLFVKIKSCPSLSIAFLAGIISWSVNSTQALLSVRKFIGGKKAAVVDMWCCSCVCLEGDKIAGIRRQSERARR